MTDDTPPEFDVDKATEGWGRINLAYDLAPFTAGPPVGLQVFLKTGERTLQTGIIAGTEDLTDSQGRVKRSVIYFAGAEGVVIDWPSTDAVFAMVAEEESDESSGQDAPGASS